MEQQQQQTEEQQQQAISGDETDSREPWKTLLEFPARAAWRITSSTPPALERALDHVSQAPYGGVKRKKKYLRRIYEQDIIQVQRDLAKRREKERLQSLRNRKDRDEQQADSKAIRPVVYGRDLVLASFHFRFLSNYAITKRVLEETQSLLGGSAWKPRRVLDMGMGVGAATAACLDVMNASGDSNIEWVHGIEPSLTMQQGTRIFLQEYVKQLQENDKEKTTASSTSSPRFTFSSYLSASADTKMTSSGFDIALLVYTATDLPYSTSTMAAAAMLWEKLSPKGVFIMIEPGTPDGFASVRTVRNLLLATNEMVDEDKELGGGEFCQILAPCTHNGPCPIESFPQKTQKQQRGIQRDVTSEAKNHDEYDFDGDDDAVSGEEDDGDSDEEDEEAERVTKGGFCSFVQSMPPREGRNKSEKFSYLVAQKRVGSDQDINGASSSFGETRIAELLTKTLQSVDELDVKKYHDLARETLDLEERYVDSTEDDLGLELLQGDANRLSFGRIIHAPMKKKRHILIDCCAAPGTITRQKISKSMSDVTPGIYGAARKSRWGGLWPVVKNKEG